MPISAMKNSIIRKQNLLVLLLFIVGVVAAVYYLRPQKSLTEDQELSIQEVILRHLFENNASSSQQNVAYYFVEINGSDPSENLLSKFEEHNPGVLPESKASLSDDLVREAYHKSDGKPGLIFSISKITLRRDGKVYVEANFFEAAFSSANYQYLLELKNDNWQVISEELVSIS